MKKNSARFVLCFLLSIVISLVSYSKFVKAAEEESTAIRGEIEVLMNQGLDVMQKYIEKFEEKYPQVNIKLSTYEDYENSVNERMRQGDYGDVLLIPGSVGSNEYASYFAPLGNTDELSKKYNFMDQSKTSGTAVYGIPSYAYLSGIIYNKEVFDKAGISELPKTTEEFMECMRLIDTHTDAIPFYTNYSSGWATQYWNIFPFVEMSGDACYKYSGFLYDENPFREGSNHYVVYRLLYDLISMGYAEADITKSDWNKSKEMLNNGEIGCMAIGSWALSQFKGAGDNPENVQFMPFPNEIDGKQYMTVLTDYSYGMASNSENKTTAKAFIDFMLDESGYALDGDNISLLPSDPYPDAFGDMGKVVLLGIQAPDTNGYNIYSSMRSKLDVEGYEFTQRVMAAAAGLTYESYEDITNDWNQKWESARPSGMKLEKTKEEKKQEATAVTPITLENTKVTLSDIEKTYINEHPKVIVGYNRNMAPFSYEDEGVFKGVAKDLCDDLCQVTGLNMVYVGYDDIKTLVEALENKEIDIIAGIEKLPNNYERIKYSKEYIDYMNVILKKKSVNTRDFTSLKAAALSGNVNTYWETVDNKIELNTIKACVENVEVENADYTVTNYYSANYYLRDAECENIDIIPTSDSGALYLGFTKDTNSSLIAICNKYIYSISDGNIQVNLLEYMEPPPKPLTLEKIVKNNPLLCITIVIIFFVVVLIFVLIVLIQKDKSNKKHALDVSRYQQLSAISDEYIFEYNFNKDIVSFDKKYKETFGFGEAVSLNDTVAHGGLADFLERLKRYTEAEKKWDEPFELMKENGEAVWYRLVISAINDEKGKPLHLIGKMTNIEKEMKKVKNYQEKAEKDALTGINNRNGFNSQVPAEAEKVVFAVLDMDNFKGVNDTLGHAGGDYALKILANALEQQMGTNAIICRYGGDEFMLLLADVSIDEAGKRLQKLVSSMDRVVAYENKEKKVSISVGAVYSVNMVKVSDLFDKADEVLYETKKAGKNGYRIKEL